MENIRIISAIFAVLLTAGLFVNSSCISANSSAYKADGVNDTLGKEVQDTLELWRRDSLGCNGIRNLYMFKYLVKELGLEYSTGYYVSAILGPANDVQIFPARTVGHRDGRDAYHRLYYFSTVCDSAGVRKGSDRCWFEFEISIETDSVLGVMARCE